MWMPAAQSWGVKGGGGVESEWPLEGETWSPLTPRSSLDSMYCAASLVVAIETSPKVED